VHYILHKFSDTSKPQNVLKQKLSSHPNTPSATI
jgi:hypothetical protein